MEPVNNWLIEYQNNNFPTINELYALLDNDEKINYVLKKLKDNLESPSNLNLLTIIYLDNKIIPKDLSQSSKYCKKAIIKNSPTTIELSIKLFHNIINQGHAITAYKLAILYKKGKYISQNIPAYIELMHRAIKLGNTNALIKLAKYYKIIEPNESIKLCKTALKMGLTDAQPLLVDILKSNSKLMKNFINDRFIIEKNIKESPIHLQKLEAELLELKYEPGGTGYLEANSEFCKLSNNNYTPKSDLDTPKSDMYPIDKWFEEYYNNGMCFMDDLYSLMDNDKKINYTITRLSDTPHDMNLMANIYIKGIYIEKNEMKALELFNKAVDSGNIFAIFNLAKYHREKNNIPKALELLTSLIENNEENYHAIHLLAAIYYDQKDIPKAIELYKKAIKLNYPTSMHNLAYIYHDQKDIPKTIELYTQAAKLDYPNSIHELAYIHYNKKENNIAIELFQKAAALNFPDSIYKLAKIYHDDIVPQDMTKVQDLLKKASYLKHPMSMDWLADIYMDNNQILKAIELYDQAANLEYITSIHKLATIYTNNKLIPEDVNKAISLYEKGVNLNDMSSMRELACILNNYPDVRNIPRAISLYKKAIDLGCSVSMNNLAALYTEYINQAPNINEIINLYNNSIKLGCTRAITNLAFFYMDGKHIEKNIKKAIKLLKKAYQLDDNHAANALSCLYYENKEINISVEYLYGGIKLNYSNSMINMAHLYTEGIHIKTNIDEAILLLKKADDLNNNVAAIRLANIYLTMDDKKNAYKYCKRAIRLNNTCAIDILSDILKDESQLIKFINKEIKREKEFDHLHNKIEILTKEISQHKIHKNNNTI
jgi:TPR repeat protein